MKILFALLFILINVGCVVAQNNDNNSLFEPIEETVNSQSVFNNTAPLVLTLEYDITSFIRHKSKGEYLDAKMLIHLNETDSIIKDIRLKARGNFRRGHCFFPPIYLNFKTDPIKNTDLKDMRKIKMVTHCSGGKAYQGYVMREYLAYKIYNILTENSFRVRLLDINYIDTGKRKRHYQNYGFLLEPVDLVAKRNNAIEVDSEVIKGPDVFPETGCVVALFEYFVGNTDWRFKSGHNMKYVKSLEEVSTKVIPVPYDFDHAGFVNTSYGMPQEWASIESITEREYLGYCQNTNENYKAAIELFVEHKDEILNTITNFEYITNRDRNQLLSFVNDFYVLAEKPNTLIRIMEDECRNLDF